MMRLIDGDALMERLGIAYDCRECDQDKPPICTWKPDAVDVCQIITDAPTIEPEPHEGYWKKDEKDDCPPVFRQFRICSVCGTIETSETNYCPDCGAKMRGD